MWSLEHGTETGLLVAPPARGSSEPLLMKRVDKAIRPGEAPPPSPAPLGTALGLQVITQRDSRRAALCAPPARPGSPQLGRPGAGVHLRGCVPAAVCAGPEPAPRLRVSRPSQLPPSSPVPSLPAPVLSPTCKDRRGCHDKQARWLPGRAKAGGRDRAPPGATRSPVLPQGAWGSEAEGPPAWPSVPR